MICSNCGKELEIKDLVEQWSEIASWYSTKFGICPHCNRIVKILKYSNEIELDINNDRRYYSY